MLKLITISVAALTLAGCMSTPPAPPAPTVDLAAEQTKIRDIEAAWVKEVAAKDFDKAAGHYTDDGVLITPGAPAFKGKDAVRAGWKGMLDDPNLKLTFAADRVEVSQSGDLAITRGPYTMTMTNPKTKKAIDDKGTYLTVYKKQADGSWKVIEDIAVSELH